MKMTRYILLAGLSTPLIAAGAGAAGDRPSTQPSPRSLNKLDRDASRIRRDGTGNPGSGNVGPGRYSAQDFDDAVAFLKDKFPNNYTLLTHMPKDLPFRNNVYVPRMVNRYRQMMRMQDQNPDAYQTMLKQSQFEDKALGMARQIRDGDATASDQLRELVRERIEASLKEREQRIEKLKQQVDEQEHKLNEDQENKDQLISDQIARTTQEYDRFFKGKDRGFGDGGNNAQDVNALRK